MTFTITFTHESDRILPLFSFFFITFLWPKFAYSRNAFLCQFLSRMKITNGLILILLPLCLSSSKFAIIKDMGDISFFERMWTHTNHLNLKKYVENSFVLQNATATLIKICDTKPENTNCEYFRRNVEQNALQARNEINEILQHRRVKRYAWLELGKNILIQVLIGCGVIGATYAIESNRMDQLQEQQNKDREMLMNLMEINHIQNNLTTSLLNRVAELEKNTKKKDDLNDLVNIARQSLEEHKKDTEIYMRIFRNNYRQDFFNINDIDAFRLKIKEINSFLWPYASLPNLDPHELLDLSSLTYTNNNTHISIHTRIPILTLKYTYPLHAFIPIPFNINDSVRILEAEANFFFVNNMNETKIMQPNLLDKCKSISNHTICDSNYHDSLDSMNECEHSIILGTKISDQCKFKKLEKRNYFVQLDYNNVYCFIIQPIKFRIACNDWERIHELKKSEEIDSSSQCEFHRVLNEMHYNGNTFSTIETNQISFKPNFSIYDEQTQKWTNDVKFLDKLINKTRGADRILHEKKGHNIFNTMGQLSTKMWSGISSFFDDISGKFYMSLCLYVVLPIVITILTVYFCVRYIKK